MTASKSLIVRTGCLTCRSRGVACDAHNPDCKRFCSTKWNSNRCLVSRRHEASNVTSATSTSESIASTATLGFTWAGTHRERQSLHFFCVISAPELSGYLDARFWQMLLLQATHSDDAIKHAVAAIGASHEHELRKQASRVNAETDGLRLFAIRQCNKAIKDLVKPTTNMDQHHMMRALTASVLFACFESLSGNREGAMPHIVHSRRLLEQQKNNRNGIANQQLCNSPVSLGIIEPLVAHHETQIGPFVGEHSPDGLINTFTLDEPIEIKTITDARVTLEKAVANLSIVCWDLLEHRTQDEISEATKQKLKYTAWLKKWDTAFSAFLARNSASMDRESMNGCRILKAHHLAGSALAGVDYWQGEEGWSAFTPKFRSIVELISEVLESTPKRGFTYQPPHTPYVSTTMGMTEPLYMSASRSTDPQVAERARKLMSKLPLSEGAHSSWKRAFIEKALCAVTGKHFDVSNGIYSTHTAAIPTER